MTRPIIAFAGLMGAGKTTAAMHLCEQHNFRRVRFAGPLKDMMRALGLTDKEIDGDLKEKPCELLGGKTPRYAMQTLGTEWGRQLITQDLWIRAWRRAVDSVPDGVGVVVDDCRFPNEAVAVRSASPFHSIIRVMRPGLSQGKHASELQTFRADSTLVNDGTITQLKKTVDKVVLQRIIGATESEDASMHE